MSDLDLLLERTSRTFALAIPRLPGVTREAVTLAYLLFRIADTFEDATCWPRSERLRALADFGSLLRSGDVDGAHDLVARWLVSPPCEHEGYLALLRETPRVIANTVALDAQTHDVVIHHAVRTAEGMATFVARSTEGGALCLANIDELRSYCYVVAGIVGELLTDLFVLHAPLEDIEATLRARARAFGEGLQLVNILKDADDDARDGRVYLPPTVARAEVLALARRDLDDANEYVTALQQAHAPRGFVAFAALPVLLARMALDALEERGAGAKISRAAVMAVVSGLDARLDGGGDALLAF